MRRYLPVLATVVVGAGHALAWRGVGVAVPPPLGVLQSTWWTLAAAYAPLFVIALAMLRRDGELVTSLRPVAGDGAIGLGAAGLAVVALYGCARVGLAVAPYRVARDLVGVVRVAASVPVAVAAAAVIAMAIVEELVWRGAVARALEARVGSARARFSRFSPWLASALFAFACVPSLHPSLVVAAACIGTACAFLVARHRRLTSAIVAHAIFTWIVFVFVLPDLWARVMRLG